jgi:integrase
VTVGQAAREPVAYPGLLAALMASVRPEFRGETLGFDPRDPVFGGPPCLVEGCDRAGRNRGLCRWHYTQWCEKKPDLGVFIATASPQWRRRPAPLACQVPGCRFGRAMLGLCSRHAGRYRRAGKPGLDAWLPDARPVAPPDPIITCLISYCDLWTRPGTVFCHAHAVWWIRHGRPDPGEFADGYDDETQLNRDRIDLRALSPQLRLELQYALQRRSDAGQARVDPMEAQRVVNFTAHAGVASLLELTEEQWRRHRPPPGPPGTSATAPRSLIIYARRQAEDLAFGRGWDVEYPRDTWRLRNLGIDDPIAHIRFGGIPQPWLRELAKRWARWRLAAGLSAGIPARGTRVIARFAAWLAGPEVNVTSITGIDRTLLERYLASLHAELGGRKLHGEHVEHLNGFLTAIRQHGWDPALPASAMIFPEDYPKRGQRLPRALAERVMVQVEDPSNLDRWDSPDRRLITLILIRCGLRIGDACKVPADCIVRDGDGQPYLRYYNHKMKREALVPIDEELARDIGEQRQRALQRWPGGAPVLFPRPTKNIDGSRPANGDAYRAGLRRWLARCDIRGEDGSPIHLTPHQFRHSLGTTLINRDVPQHVVQKILDHDSAEMTAHYARLTDTTVRRHWEAARKVNARGETVTLDPAGPLAEAAWAKQRIARATQALPNGYCQLPVVKTCPHANACLTCPMFVTTPEFLPQHHAQRQATLQLITAAEAAGHARLAEMNKQVAANLDKIITALEDGGGNEREAAAGAS